MQYFVPDIKPLASADSLKFPERLGGLPLGLPAELWPRCNDCGKSQSLLAQFAHHPERLDLGREGRMLFVFQCAHDPGMCATWELFSGANACVVVESERLGTTETPSPSDMPPLDECVLIFDWLKREDEVSPAEAEAFFDDERFLQLGDSVWRKASMLTRLGGVPSWMQGASEWPGPPWRFIGQLDSTYAFYTPPEPVPLWVSPDEDAWEGRTHWAQGPNFGGGGIAYVFTRQNDEEIEACMFWQC